LSVPFDEILHRFREDVGLLDGQGGLLWCNRVLARRTGLPSAPAEPVPAARWVAKGSLRPLMQTLIAVQTGLTPPGERLTAQLTLLGTKDRRVELIASIQGLDDGQLLLVGREPRVQASPHGGLLPSQADFLANMSHELRTPLNAIIGYSELLVMPEFELDDEKRRQYGADILDSGRHLLGLIDDVLEFAKAGSGRMTIRVQEVHVAEELAGCLKVAEGLAMGLGRQAVFHLATEGKVGHVLTDLRLFKQIVVNLLSNAVKYSPDGGRVELAARRAGGWLQVAVRDQGMGIDPAEAERIFSPFYQVDGSSRRQSPGMGLGLAIVQRFLELLGGGIRLRSRPGVGSTFTFWLPADGRTVPRDAQGRPVSGPHDGPEDSEAGAGDPGPQDEVPGGRRGSDGVDGV